MSDRLTELTKEEREQLRLLSEKMYELFGEKETGVVVNLRSRNTPKTVARKVREAIEGTQS